MKKTLSLLLTLAALLCLAACGEKTPDAPAPDAQQKEVKWVYGTATLSYAEFYAGDVSSVTEYDAVTSATTSKHSILANMATDFVDEEKNAKGYHITGVKNVNIAVAEDEADAYLAANATFVRTDGGAPAQYKPVHMENGKAVYGATVFNVADTVTDASAKLLTGTNWGDYQINVTDGATIHLRNDRTDEFDINSEIQGVILETAGGLKVGLEALQSIWVQPYEVSFNVEADNSHNTHISGYDNLRELSKLSGETLKRITYIMPEAAYVYEFDGLYIKPIYDGSITANLSGDELTLSTADLGALGDATITVTYTLGKGKERQVYTLLETTLVNGAAAYAVDRSEVRALADQSGVYAARITSSAYADIALSLSPEG